MIYDEFARIKRCTQIMVRAKFPGKPSKITNRKVVRVCHASLTCQESDASLVAEDIWRGLAAFRSICDEEEENPDFYGFSQQDIQVAKKRTQKRCWEIKTELSDRGIAFPTFVSEKNNAICQIAGAHDEAVFKERKFSEACKVLSNEKYKVVPKSAKEIKTVLPKENAVSQTDCLLDKIPNTVTGRRFILPSHSSHSSRVIKPNKRFLDADFSDQQIAGSSSVQESSEQIASRGLKLKKSRLMLASDYNVDSVGSWLPREQNCNLSHSVGDSKKPSLKKGSATSSNFSYGNVKSATRVIIRKARLNVDTGQTIAVKGPFSSTNTKSKSLINSKPLIPTMIVCGVCRGIRSYRYLKQARKFGSLTCESCRKYITRMIKLVRDEESPDVLECMGGKGECMVPAVAQVITKGCNNPKLTSHYKRRCDACWLKLCLKSFSIPKPLSVKLKALLPSVLRTTRKAVGPRILQITAAGSLLGKEDAMLTDPKKLQKIAAAAEQRLVETNLTERGRKLALLTKQRPRNAVVTSLANIGIARFTSLHQSTDTQLAARSIKKKATAIARRDTPSSRSKEEEIHRCSKKKVTEDKSPDKPRRQKLHLKGPRVKHVCRSASLVLGQPVATFTAHVAPSIPAPPQPPPPTKTKTVTKKERTHSEQPAAHKFDSKAIRDVGETKPTSSGPRMRLTAIKEVVSKEKEVEKEDPPPQAKLTNVPPASSLSVARTLQDLGRQNCELLDGVELQAEQQRQNMSVAIDFWESYDPDIVSQVGFALICSRPPALSVRALCFLCGSAGQDKLVHCACCCEPYHEYCATDGAVGMVGGKTKWRIDWVCPRCTVCVGCGLAGGGDKQVVCHKCRSSYHATCLARDSVASRLHSPDRPWVCPSCLRCKSCNAAAVSKFVGNLALCKTCFVLRQKGNFCPLCQSCYNDNDFDTKMMECSHCKSWVHAKCEGLSNEKYQVLSFLPESVEFVCRMCCKLPPAPWWLAVEAELKAGYIAVLKTLSKNRKACDLLKWSPKKSCSSICVCRSGPRSRTLRLPDFSEQSDVESVDCGRKAQEELDEQDFPFASQHILNHEDVFERCVSNRGCKSSECCREYSLVREADIVHIGEKFEQSDMKLKSNMKASFLPFMKSCISEELQLRLNDSDGHILNIPFQGIEQIKGAQFSPHATSQSDSGIGSTDDELKPLDDRKDVEITEENQCFCQGLDFRTTSSPSLLSIKKKVNGHEFSSLFQFHEEMLQVVNSVQGTDLLKVYQKIVRGVFPWFDNSSSQVSDSQQSDSVLLKVSSPSRPGDGVQSCSSKISQVADACSNGLFDHCADYYYCEPSVVDTRMCVLCKIIGEGSPSAEARLLYCGYNEWIHANCALWSNEVFEEIDGSLQNVHNAISRSRHIRCTGCSKKGASIGCCIRSCAEIYHFSCARAANCTFLEDKSVFCTDHFSEMGSKPLHNPSDFPIMRPVYVELEHRKKKYVPRHQVHLMVGSLLIESLGEFLPEVSDQKSVIVPCEFQCTRLYWSSVEPWRIVQYHIKTKILHSPIDYVSDEEENFTLDHSLEEKTMIASREVKENDICRIIEHLLDIVCAKEDDGSLSDTQNAADLLPPELTDVIFEDLPHDILDGISMQDIFPKMMSYDDIISSDLKSDKGYKSDSNSDAESIQTVISRGCKCNDDSGNRKAPRYVNVKQYKNNRIRSIQNHKKDSVVQSSQKEGKEYEWKKSRCQLDFEVCNSDGMKGSQSVLATAKTSCSALSMPQLDGAGNSVSDSESESTSQYGNEDSGTDIQQLDGAADCDSSEDSPVKCPRCHRTYRTAMSYDRHLPTCNAEYILSFSSESESSEEEKATTPPAEIGKIVHCNEEIVITDKSNLNELNRHIQHATSNNSICLETTQPCDPAVVELIELSPISQSESNCYQFQDATYQSQQQILSTHLKSTSAPQIQNPSRNCTNKNSYHVPNMKSATKLQYQAPLRKKRVKVSEPQPQPRLSSQTDIPSLIIQQMPSQNIFPTYHVDAYSNQSAHNVQYIATLDTQDKTQYTVVPNPLIPGSFHIQPVNQLPVLPTVLGTLIQPNGSEHIIVNTPHPTINTFGQQMGNVYISNPAPMYINMETVVSSQYVSATVPGVLASSYSATTTQVFQSAKPMLELPHSYAVINSQPTNTVLPSLIPQITQQLCVQPQPYTLLNHQLKEERTYQSFTIHQEKNFESPKIVEIPAVNQHEVKIIGIPTIVKEPELKNNLCQKLRTPISKMTESFPEHPKTIENIPKSSFDKVPSDTAMPTTTPSLIDTHPLMPVIPNLETPKIPLSIKDSNAALVPVVQQNIGQAMCDEVPVRINQSVPPEVSGPCTLEQHKDELKDIKKPLLAKAIHSKPKNGKCLKTPVILTIPETKSLRAVLDSKSARTIEVVDRVLKKASENNINTLGNYSNGKLQKNGKKGGMKCSTSPKIVYEINSQDGFSYSTSCLAEAWQKVFDAVQSARAIKGLTPLPQNPFACADSTFRTLGLENNSVKFLLEQLPGVARCIKYQPSYHKPRFLDSEQDPCALPPENTTGCARTEPFSSRSKYDMFSWLASRHRRPPKLIVSSDTEIVNGNRRTTSLNLPMAMRFRHLRESSKESVGVFRSDIHGRGLFCLRDIDSGEMVIEYAGEVVRSGLTDMRERYYNSKGIGCYMFRIDDQFVVDATMRGNAARFINHSCEPNCYSRVVDILGKKHILIFALRRIPQGEELTYDYKFPLEDDKINCHCLSRKCRKYLN